MAQGETNGEPPAVAGRMDRRQLLTRGAAVALTAGVGVGVSQEGAAAVDSPERALPQRGGSIRVSGSDASSNDSLDPALLLTGTQNVAGALIYSTLVKRDNNWHLHPMLAKGWEHNRKATQWTFHLHPGIQFHDGSLLQASDVVYSLKRILNPKVGADQFNTFSKYVSESGIVALDKYTVRLNLNKPHGFIPHVLSTPGTRICKAGQTDFTQPPGTGPFVMKSFQPGVGFRVVRNPNYWESGLPYLDSIEWVVHTEPSTKVQSVISGDSDLCDYVQLGALALAKQAGLRLFVGKSALYGPEIVFDRRVHPYSKPDVITAMKMLTDRHQYNRQVYSGTGVVNADVPVVATDETFYAKDLKYPKYDVATAKELLKGEGVRNLKMNLWTWSGAEGMVAASILFKQLASQAGINVRITTADLNAYFAKGWLVAPTYISLLVRYHPSQILPLLFRSDAPWNEAKWPKGSALDKLVDSLFAITNPAKQIDRVKEIEHFINAHTTSIVPVYGPYIWPAKKRLHNVIIDLNWTADLYRAYVSS